MNNTWFTEARHGLFIHYGLYSLLERGEWVWNREEIPREEYKALAAQFTTKQFDADFLCRMAVEAGICVGLIAPVVQATELFTYDLQERGNHRGDWNFYGPMTVKENSLFWLIHRPHGDKATLGGLENKVRAVRRLDNSAPLPFTQVGSRIQISEVPTVDETGLWPVLKIECDGVPVIYQSGGLRVPKTNHPHYDPCPSEIAH